MANFNRGDARHNSKVTERQITCMIELRRKGVPPAEIARRFGIVRDTVYKLTSGKGRVRE